MDTRIFSAYNEASKRSLSAGLLVVDAAREPLKVLKVLMEGLPKSASGGLWFINFKGVPVARSQTPFDLVYLDEHARVVQAIEISPTSVFESFRGSPASAFILPPKSVSQSKTFTGDRIVVNVVGNQPAPAPPRVPAKSTIARTPTRVIPTPAGRGFNTPSSGGQSAASGSLLRSASAIIAPPAAVAEAARETVEASAAVPVPAAQLVQPPHSVELEPQPSAEPVQPEQQAEPAEPLAAIETLQPEPDAQPAIERELHPAAQPEPQTFAVAEPEPEMPPIDEETAIEAIPDNAAAEILPPAAAPPSVADVHAEAAPESHPAPPAESQGPYVVLVDPAPPEEDTEAATAPDEESASEPAAVEPAAMDAASEAPFPFAASDAPVAAASPLAELLLQPPPDALAKPMPPILRNTWDVRLLYFFFPKLHPSYRPEFQAPRVGLAGQSKKHDEGKLTTELRVLSWLYPDLQLETVHLRQREARRAPRVANPGLVGYFFTGGVSKPNEIRNLSVTGFYMKTEERWLPGTVIRITLQMLSRVEDDPGDTITVHSRVVNWNSEGGGFEFVLPGFVD